MACAGVPLKVPQIIKGSAAAKPWAARRGRRRPLAPIGLKLAFAITCNGFFMGRLLDSHSGCKKRGGRVLASRAAPHSLDRCRLTPLGS